MFSVPLLGIALAASAHAGPPDPSHSTVPKFVRVGGKQTGNPSLPDPSLAYTVTVRDFANNPVAGSTVVINFTNCIELRLCSFNLGAQTVDCLTKTVTLTTNGVGQATFSILGAGTLTGLPVSPPIAAGAGAGCATISADGVPLGTATAVIYDIDGAVPPLGVGPAFHNGVKGLDLNIVFADVNAGYTDAVVSGACGAGPNYRGRCDYNEDGVINSLDISRYVTILGNSNAGTGSGNGCSDNTAIAVPYCP
jgi:hypothetical protein